MKKRVKKKLAILLTFVLAFSLVGPLNMQVKAAGGAKEFKVDLNASSGVGADNKTFSFKDATIINANGSSAKVTSLTVMVSAGSIQTDSDAITNSTKSIATWVWTEDGGASVQAVQDKLRTIKFNYADTMKVTVIVDGNKMNLPSQTNITSYTLGAIPQGSAEIGKSMHYYMYVPYGAKKQDWYDAYNVSKEYYFMGMQGYLVTITESGEDDVLDEISGDGAWAGGARVSTKMEVFDSATFTENLRIIAPTDSVWKWVCGPEAGIPINIKGSNAEQSGIGGAKEDTYQNWRRPTSGNEYETNQEPNNYASEDDPKNDGEWWLQVHFPTGGWNDLNGDTMTKNEDDIDYLSGYFVEFSEYEGGFDPTYSEDKKVTAVGNPAHTHDYTVSEGASKGEIVAHCGETFNSANCDVPSVTMQATAANATYTGEEYNGVTITNAQAVQDWLEEYSGAEGKWDVKVTYAGRNGTVYAESETGPVNAGNYNAIVTFVGPNDQKFVIEEPFTINKAKITVKANNLTVEAGEALPTNPESVTITNGKLMGTDVIDSVALSGNTATISITTRTLSLTDVVIKNGDVDVTSNYEITKTSGRLSVTRKLNHNWTAKPESENPGVLDVYCTNPSDGCKIDSAHPEKLTLETPEATYTGEPCEEATVKDVDNVLNKINNGLPSDQQWTVKVTYEGRDGTVYDESTVPPTDAGKYNAIMTLTNPADPTNGTYVTKKPFEIAKKEITITPNPQEISKSGIVSSTPADVDCDGLVTGDEIIEVKITGDTTKVTDVGVLSVDKDSVVIKNGEKDVTDNYIIKTENGVLTVTSAKHDWNAKVDGSDPDVIDIYCNSGDPVEDPDCPYVDPENAIQIITTVPDATYTGQPYDGTDVDDGGIIDAINADLPDDEQWGMVVTYEGRDGTEYGETDKPPVDAGKYNAIVTVTDPEGNETQIKKPFEIEKANLTIKPKDKTIVLEGDISATPADVDPTGLVNGDKITTIKITGDTDSLTNNGALVASKAEIKNGEKDVTNNYNITYQPGLLKVVEVQHDWVVTQDAKDPDVIDIYCDNGEAPEDPDCPYVGKENAVQIPTDIPDAVYDGEPYDDAIVDVDEIDNILNKDVPQDKQWDVEVTYEGRDGTEYDESVTAPTDAGKYNAIITITDPEGNETEFKKPFEITKKEVTLTPNPQEIGKNGIISSTPDDVDKDGLEAGDEIVKVTITGDTTNVTDAGVLTVDKDSVVIKNGEKDVTDNYIIKTETGTLTVLPAKHDWNAKVDDSDPNVIDIYCDNGNPTEDPNCPYVDPENVIQVTATVPDATYTGEPYEGVDVDDSGIKDIINKDLPKDEQWSVVVTYEGRDGTDYDETEEPPVDAGKYNAIVTVIDSEGNETQIKKPFEIKTVDITIKPKDKTVVLDGTVSAKPKDIVEPTGLVNGDKVTAIDITGDTDSLTDNGVLTASNAVIKNGEKDVTDNYNITYQPGTLKVVETLHDWVAEPEQGNPIIDIYCDGDPAIDPDCPFDQENAAQLELVAPKATYTGEPYNKAEIIDADEIIDEINAGLSADEQWVATLTFEGRGTTVYPESENAPVEVGKYNAIMTVTNLADPENGTYVVKTPFEITKKELIITPKTQEIGEGGQVSSNPNDVTPEGLASKDKIVEITINGDTSEITDEGVLTVVRESVVIKRGDENVTKNYTITVRDGILKVFPPEHDWEAKVDDNDPTVIDVFCDNGDPVEDPNCPYVGPENGAQITTDAPDAVYTGNPYPGAIVDDDIIDQINDGLPEDEQWTVKVTYEGRDGTKYPESVTPPTDAGKYNAVVTVTDPDDNEVQIKKPFEITKQTVTVTPVEQYVELGGTVASGPEYVKANGLVNGDVISAANIAGNASVVTKAGIITVDPVSIVIKNGEKDVTGNYNIEVEDGKLIVPADHKWDAKPDPKDTGVLDVYCENGDPETDPGCNHVGPEEAGQIQLVAPSDPYTGKPYEGVKVVDNGLLDDINDDLPPEKQWTVSDPIYEGRDGTTYPESDKAPADAGKYNAVVTITDSDGNEYVVKTPFEIEKRKLVITPKDQVVEDGKNVSSTPKDVTVDGLAPGDVVANITIKPNANKTKTTANNATIKNGNKDVTDNYDITYAEGNLTSKNPTSKPDTPSTPVTTEDKNVIVPPTAKEVYENETAMNAGLKVMQTKKQINVKWGAVPGANRYEIFVQYCGKKFKKKPTKVVNNAVTTKVKVTKINGKKLNLKKNYKIFIVAYKVSGSQKVRLGESIRAHIVGVKNTKQTNVKAVKVKKSKFTIQQGKTAQIKAWTVLVDKTKHQLSNAHAKALRYRTDNEKVATVSAKGKIKAVGKGTCTVYVYARNGYAKKVTVTVK